MTRDARATCAAWLAAFLSARGAPDPGRLAQRATGAAPAALPSPPGADDAAALLAALEAELLEPDRVQVMTPPPVARWLAAQALPEPARALDPAAGTGRLLLAALERLVDLGLEPGQASSYVRGIERDPTAAAIANAALAARSFELGAPLQGQAPVEVGDALLRDALPRARAILLNPPYQNADALPPGHHARLADKLPFHRRQLDQSVFFLAIALEHLPAGGRLAAIAPRYWLESTGAGPFRRWLAERADLHLIADLGNHQVWPAVNVLTALLSASRRPPAAPAAPAHLLRLKDAEGLRRLLAPGGPPRPDPIEVAPERLDEAPWTFRPPRLEATLGALQRGTLRAGDWLEIGQGVKTGRNAVFVLSRERADALELPEELLAPTARTRDLAPFSLSLGGEVLLMVMDEHDPEQWPTLRGYLEPHRADLERRYQVRHGKARWYALALPQNLALMERPAKILTPLYARTNSFAIDRGQRVVRTDLYVLAPRPSAPVPLEAIVAALNSAPLRLWVKARAKLKRDSYLEFGRRLLVSLPLPWTPEGEPLSGPPEATARLAALSADAQAGEDTAGAIDALCWEMFGVAPPAQAEAGSTR